jgi:hypothetical protein
MEDAASLTRERVQDGTSRSVGRPSVAAPFAPQINQWLRENANISGAEILRRVQLAGYRGRKSALYELVKRLRVKRTVLDNTTESSSERRTERQ